MTLETVRKPSTKPPRPEELQERRKQVQGNIPAEPAAVPRYLHNGADKAAAPASEKAPALPRYLQGQEPAATTASKPAASSTPTTAASSAQKDLKSGEPLPPELASRFSKAYQHDLSQVRVHPESQKAADLGAQAYTVGKDVAFAPGTYQPATAQGQRLLGHELAHVVQQSQGKPTVQGKGLASDDAEKEADTAADAALSGAPTPPLSPVGEGTVQLKPAGAPASSPASKDSKAGAKAQAGEIDLTKGTLEPDRVKLDGGKAMARLGNLAAGEIELVESQGSYKTRGQGHAIPLTIAPLESVLGGKLVLVVKIENNVITGHAAIGKPGRTAPRNDKGLFGAITKTPESLGLLGLSKLGVKSITNSLENGVLKVGADSVDFTLSGFVKGSGQLHFENEQMRFGGEAEVTIPGGSGGKLKVMWSRETGLEGDAHLEVSVGKVSGGVDARLRQGALDIMGTASYAADRLKGSITLVATDEATARDITLKDPQAGELPGASAEGGTGAAGGGGAGAAAAPGAGGAAAAPQSKPGPRAFCGWGELDFSLTEWLTGKAKVVVGSTGEATVRGEIAPPKEIILFEQKDWTKSLFKTEVRAAYGLPVVGNVFVFANIGLEALATIGPGKLYNIKLSGQYSTDKRADKELNLQASLNISAFAGLRLRAEGGVGVELLGHDIKAGVGVWALAGVRGYVEATPTIGYREKAGSAAEFYIKGHMELAAQPFLGLGGDLFVEVDSPWWSPLPDDKWTWPLGSIEYPLPGEFGLGADVEHVLGSKQWPEVKFSDVDFDSSKFMSDLLSESAPSKSKSGEDKKPAKWNEDGGGKPGGGEKSAPPANKPGDKSGKSKDSKNTKPGKGSGSKKDKKGKGKKGKDKDSGTAPNQIGERVQFAAAGDSYELWVQSKGKSATLMVSKPQQNVSAWLSAQEKKASTLPPEKEDKAKALLGQARQLGSQINKDARQLASGKADKASVDKLQDKIRKDQHALSGVLKSALELAGKPDEQNQAPKSLVEPHVVTLDHPSPELAAALLTASSGQVLHQTGGDAKQVTQKLLAEHPDARLDKDSGRLTLPPLKDAALESAPSLAELGARIAQQTGVSKVTLEKDGKSVRIELHINPDIIGANATLEQLYKSVQLQTSVGILDFNGALIQGVDLSGTMEQIILEARRVQAGLDQYVLKTAAELKGKGNLAMANIQVAGKTKGGIVVVYDHPIGNADVLKIFSSGSGEISHEKAKFRIVDAQGRELRAAQGLDAEALKTAPQLLLNPVEIVTVGKTDEGSKDLEKYLKLAELIPGEGKINPQMHKHSEEAIWALFREKQAMIAKWIDELDVVEISQMVVNIHSEREMCFNCAKATNDMMNNMEKRAEGIWEALKKKKAMFRPVTNVTSSVEFSQSAPKVEEGSGVLTHASAPTVGTGGKTEIKTDPEKPLDKEEINKLQGPRVTPRSKK
jgi:hypothetical protein